MKRKEYCSRKNCMYWTNPAGSSPNSCNYMMFTGKSRIAQIPNREDRRDFDKCPCFRRGPNLKGRLFDPGELRAGIDWTKGYAQWREGKLDAEIAEALGCSKSAVKWWRRQNGLTSNWRAKK